MKAAVRTASLSVLSFTHVSPRVIVLTNPMYAAYAVYFDHRRRTDPEFRKALKRESRREARAAKEEAEAQGALQKQVIKAAVEEAKAVDYPADVEEKEAYFLGEVGRGEVLCQDGMAHRPFVLDPVILTFTCRVKSNGGSSMLFQSSESIPSARRLDTDIRQDSAEASPGHSGRDDCI